MKLIVVNTAIVSRYRAVLTPSKLTSSPVPTTDYDDTNLQGGQTRYYVATSVNASNEESSYSKEVAIQIP